MLIIGHRGARGLAAENTIESIKAALNAGVDGIEVDVRATSDDIVILSHDAYLIDENSGKWKISQHTYDFLHNRQNSLATLRQAVEILPPSCLLRVEIKPDEPVEPLVALLRPMLSNPEAPSISVVSFDYRLLKTLHQTFPELPLILNEKWSSVRAQLRAKKLGTKQIQMNQRWLWRGFLRAMKHGGYKITPYTVNSPKQAKRWEPYIEGIITDYPDRFSKEPQ
jgi:glycerophosphoryl diester phosphodiesterase